MEIREFVPEQLRPHAKRVHAKVFANQPFRRWQSKGFAMPAPAQVKWSVLHRYGNPTDTWIETGTFRGDTTAFLAKSAKHVYSIEPGQNLASTARQRFATVPNVTIVEGLAEDHIGSLLHEIRGPLSLWLDGHFSGEITHQGPEDTPIRTELAAVEERLDDFEQLSVLVDDVRCFDPTIPEYATYPTRSWLVHWADRCNLTWGIEQDIFYALKGRRPA